MSNNTYYCQECGCILDDDGSTDYLCETCRNLLDHGLI